MYIYPGIPLITILQVPNLVIKRKQWRQRLSVTIIRGWASDGGGGGGGGAGEGSGWQRRDPRGDPPALPRLNGL
jgi:hypothetical protein